MRFGVSFGDVKEAQQMLLRNWLQELAIELASAGRTRLPQNGNASPEHVLEFPLNDAVLSRTAT
jgi:hypothetical protein